MPSDRGFDCFFHRRRQGDGDLLVLGRPVDDGFGQNLAEVPDPKFGILQPFAKLVDLKTFPSDQKPAKLLDFRPLAAVLMFGGRLAQSSFPSLRDPLLDLGKLEFLFQP